jgi:hypothetical protein
VQGDSAGSLIDKADSGLDDDAFAAVQRFRQWEQEEQRRAISGTNIAVDKSP